MSTITPRRKRIAPPITNAHDGGYTPTTSHATASAGGGPTATSSPGATSSSTASSSGASSSTRERQQRIAWHTEQMTHVFECFAGFGGALNSANEMDGTHFVRMLREVGLVDRTLFTPVDADLLFRKIKEKNGRFLTVQMFLAYGLPEIAARRRLSKERAAAMLYEGAEAFVEVPLTAAEAKLMRSSQAANGGFSPANRSVRSPLQRPHFAGGEYSFMERSATGDEGGNGEGQMPLPQARLKARRPPSASGRGGGAAAPIAHSNTLRSPSAAGRPPTRFKHVRSSSAAAVRLHDDRSLYTGVSRRGGASAVDRDASDLAAVVDRRRVSNVRGAVV